MDIRLISHTGILCLHWWKMDCMLHFLFFFLYLFVCFFDRTEDQSQPGYQCISYIKVQFGQTLERFYSHTSGESKLAAGSSIKPETNQPSRKKMTGRMSYCLWTDVLLVRNTSPRGWETDRSRPACDDSSKLRCIAFTGVMKSGHQRGKKTRN